MKAKPFLLALLLAFPSAAARAYNGDGHMQIADIAWTKLTPHAKEHVRRILMAGDPMYCPAGDAGGDVRDAFRRAATFPDDIKFHLAQHAMYSKVVDGWTYYFYPGQRKPTTADSEAPLCKSWHFYDTPLFVPAGQTPPALRTSNALSVMTYAERHLRSLVARGQQPQLQAWWLYWIEHLTGDLHQPLHCATSFAILPQGDAGGNKFPIATADKELHAYWDAGIDHAWVADAITGTTSTERIVAATATWGATPGLQPSASAARDVSPKHWIRDGARAAQTVVYRGIAPHGTPDAAYLAAQVAVCKRLALLAGYRLAAYLNNAL